jgi:DNA-binding transcriptional regulator YdaS (Cro superfamily)
MSGRLVPRKGIMLRHKHVRNAVTIEIYESEIGVSPVDVGQGPEGKEWIPPTVTCTLVKARYGSVELNNVQPAIAIKVEARWENGGT